MAEYAIDKVESENLSQKVMTIQRMIPAGEGWKLTVMIDLDGTGNLVATNLKTGSSKSLYLGLCSIKRPKNTERRK